MASYVLVILVMYMMHFDFAHKLYNKTAIFLSLSTAGWSVTGDQSWTKLGQPHDTGLVVLMLLVSSLIGYAVERMLRSSFLQRRSELRLLSEELHSASSHAVMRAAPELSRDLAELASSAAGRQYETVGLLGRGGSGDVFLVRRRSGGRDGGGELSAMKRIAKARLQPAQVARVLEECRILQAIAHPFVVRLEAAFETQDFFLLEMSYAGGGDLTFWVGRFTATSARLASAEVLLGLGYLHSQSILYRDVKLENTLVALDGHVMLADFGVSKTLRAGAASCSTHTLVGTPDYMSPEQFAGEAYSFEIDFWALGVMLHEMLTSEGIGARSAPVICASGLMDDASADLLRRMLAPDRARRLGGGPGGFEAIRAHPYFATVDFAAVVRKEGPGPLCDHTASRPVPLLPPRVADRATDPLTSGSSSASWLENGSCDSCDESMARGGGFEFVPLRRRTQTPSQKE